MCMFPNCICIEFKLGIIFFFFSTFLNILNFYYRLGYEGFYKKRVHENFDEGETTFYKTSRFSDPENTAYSLKQLIDKVSNKILPCYKAFMPFCLIFFSFLFFFPHLIYAKS